MAEMSVEEVLAEVRRTLRVPEGQDIIDYTKSVVRMINEIAKEVKELKIIVEEKANA